VSAWGTRRAGASAPLLGSRFDFGNPITGEAGVLQRSDYRALDGVIVEMLGSSSEGVGIPTTGVCDSGVPSGASDRSGARFGAFGTSNAQYLSLPAALAWAH
jgi:hypothetical protein